jgi:hypothetical protein
MNSKFEDADDILDKRTAFIGQVNNVLGYFNMLDAVVKHKLFSAYFSSFYGCEFWPMDHGKLDTFLSAWRKAVRCIWNSPRPAHSASFR